MHTNTQTYTCMHACTHIHIYKVLYNCIIFNPGSGQGSCITILLSFVVVLTFTLEQLSGLVPFLTLAFSGGGESGWQGLIL